MGGVAALLATVSLAVVWLPYSVSTIQQFRSGIIPSLYDCEFKNYRLAPDLTTILFGAAFWGTFYTSAVLFAVVGGFSFLLVWEFTRGIVMTVLANLIDIAVTMVFKKDRPDFQPPFYVSRLLS